MPILKAALDAATNSTESVIKLAETLIVNSTEIAKSASKTAKNLTESVETLSEGAKKGASIVYFTLSIFNNLSQAGNALSDRLKSRLEAYNEKKNRLEAEKAEIEKNTSAETLEANKVADVENRNMEIQVELNNKKIEFEKLTLEFNAELNKLEIEQDKLKRLHEIAMLQQKQEIERKSSWVIEKEKLDSLKDEEDNMNRIIGRNYGYKDSKCKAKGYNEAHFYRGLGYTYKIEYLMDGPTFITVDYTHNEGYFVTIGGLKYKLKVENNMKKKWYGRYVVEAIGKLERLHSNSNSDTVSLDDITLNDKSEEKTLLEIDTEKYQSEIEKKEFQLITKKIWFKIKLKGGKTRNKKNNKRKTRNKKNNKMKTRKHLR